jgi:hypothetical protein
VGITNGFPQPTKLIRTAFVQLQVARSGDEDEVADLGPLSDLPRPWDPPSCPPSLRHELWLWLDTVAGWINHDYSWQADNCIPGCWPAHPHIAHELAVVAALRLEAGHALSAGALEEWHHYALPGFLDRMTNRLGGSGCPPGKHHDWPAAGRHRDYESVAGLNRRLKVFSSDTERDR